MKKLFVRFKYHEKDGGGMNSFVILTLSSELIQDLTNNHLKIAIFHHRDVKSLEIRDAESIDVLIMTALN